MLAPPNNALLLLLSSGLAHALPHVESRSSKKTLHWGPCDLDFPESLVEQIKLPVDCATLEVPLDYTDSRSEPLELQLIRVNATDGGSSGKSVLFNPGGPGGSGIEFVAAAAVAIRDPYLGGKFDLIGFDPRGTGRTIPFSCGDENEDEANTRRRGLPSLPQMDSYDYLKKVAWEDAGLFAKACAEKQAKTGRFLTTPFVARDMLSIVDALNEDGKLRYWGISYGTILGQTFANMFPDRIDRLVVDANVIMEHYYRSSMISTPRDAEDSLLNVFRECIAAGVKSCPLASVLEADDDADDLMDLFSDAMEKLIANPIPLPEVSQGLLQPQGSMNVYIWVKSTLQSLLYKPQDMIAVTELVGLVIAEDWTTLTEHASTPATKSEKWSLGTDAFHGIGCSDGWYRASSPEELYPLVQAQTAGSEFGDMWGFRIWACARWPFEGAERFEGTFKSINTSFPLLFINGPYDPVTPLSGAWEMSTHFVGSGFLQHNGHGHGSMGHPSKCTKEYARKYFVDGTLPPPGTQCEPDHTGFTISLTWAAQQNQTQT